VTMFGLAIRTIALFAGAIYISGGDDGVQKVNELLQATPLDLQAKRVVTISEHALKGMSRIDFAIAIRKDTLESLTPFLLKSLNDARAAKAAGVVFQNIKFYLADQVVGLQARFTKAFGATVVDANLQVSAYVGATGNVLVWNLYPDGIEVTRIKGGPRLSEASISSLASQINRLMPVVKAVLDETVNNEPSKAVLLKFDEKTFSDEAISNVKADDFVADKKELKTGFVDRGNVALINKNGIFVASQVAIKPDDITTLPPVFPKADQLIRQGRWPRVDAYQEALLNFVQAETQEDLAPLVNFSNTGMAVTKGFLARLIMFSVNGGAISGTLSFRKPFRSESELRFKIGGLSCDEYFLGCDYKNICDRDKCVRSVTDVIGANETINVLEPVAGAQCDTFRAVDKLLGGKLCDIASHVDKAFCDANASLRNTVCNIEQRIRRFYEQNPVARVTANLQPDLKANIETYNSVVLDNLNSIEVTALAHGGGSLRAGLKYDRLNYKDTDAIPPQMSLGTTCTVDWSENVNLSVTAEPVKTVFTFESSSTVKPTKQLSIDFSQVAAQMIQIDFKPPALVALLAGKPQVILDCPLAELGTVGFAAAEAVFTQDDARQMLPLLTGQGFPIEIKHLNFSIKLDPIKVCPKGDESNCSKPLIFLAPDMTPSAIRFLETQP
jgi:hypothetical protein